MRLNLANRRTKPRLKGLTLQSGKPQASGFVALVREAIAVTRQLVALRQSTAERLSASAFLDETLELGSDHTRIEKLRRRLEAGDPGLESAQSTLRLMMKQLREPTFKTPPTRTHWGRTERWLTTPESRGELAKLGYSGIDLLGVAIQKVGEDFPETFGNATSTTAVQAKLSRLEAKQAELFNKIATTWTADDVNAGARHGDAVSAATFKVSDGAVPIAPIDNSGKRLVDFLLAHGKRI